MSFRRPPDDPELARLWLVLKEARERERDLKRAVATTRKAVTTLRFDADRAQIAQTEQDYHAARDALDQAQEERYAAERLYHARQRLVVREQQMILNRNRHTQPPVQDDPS